MFIRFYMSFFFEAVNLSRYLSCPSMAWKSLGSKRFPSKQMRFTCESDSSFFGILEAGRQFSSILSTFKRGHKAIDSEILLNWFWFKLSSVDWSPPIPSGISEILFFDKSMTSKCLSWTICSGKEVSALSFNTSVRRLANFSSVVGRLVRQLLLTSRVSSFLRSPIVCGSVLRRLLLRLTCLRLVKDPM